MQISNILNESITMDEVNSQPFIEDFEGLELYHATPKKFDEIQKFNFRFREKPQTSVVEIHDAINRISQEKFGLPIRNLLFCFPQPSTMYGYPYKIVPIGNFRMFYHPGIHDMTVDLGFDEHSTFTYDNGEYIKKLSTMIPSPYTEELGQKIFDEEMLFDFDEEHLREMIDELGDEYEDGENFNDFSKTIYDNKEKLFKLQQSAIVDVMEHYASEYVSGLVEISPYNYDEIDNEEIMVYAPNGFYVVPI